MAVSQAEGPSVLLSRSVGRGDAVARIILAEANPLRADIFVVKFRIVCRCGKLQVFRREFPRRRFDLHYGHILIVLRFGLIDLGVKQLR